MLFTVKQTKYIETQEYVTDIVLVESPEPMTDEEFYDLANRYSVYTSFPYRLNDAWGVAHALKENHGFRIVPYFSC